MSLSMRLPTSLRRYLLAQLCLALALPFATAQTTTPPAESGNLPEAKKVPVIVAAAPAKDSDVVELSPFEVKANTKGYYSANTMSGTRFNTKLDDLASSITVMTKEQMSDFGMLDINDVFRYV